MKEKLKAFAFAAWSPAGENSACGGSCACRSPDRLADLAVKGRNPVVL